MHYIFSNKQYGSSNSLKKKLKSLGIYDLCIIKDFYILSYDEQLSNKELSRISKLLNSNLLLKKLNSKYYFSILSRAESLSPWSSKAKQIITSCGFKNSLDIERIIVIDFKNNKSSFAKINKNKELFFDQMTENCLTSKSDLEKYLQNTKKLPKLKKSKIIPLNKLSAFNKNMGLALSNLEIIYLNKIYKKMNRDPLDIELMMFSQINSEHCRHKIFNSDISGKNLRFKTSLFKLIKKTFTKKNDDVISAYSDNCSIIKSNDINFLYSNLKSKTYKYKKETGNYIIKAETHNHPTAISPFVGAATGSGGELRDEGATGKGSMPKVGFTGYTLSNLSIPDDKKVWEKRPIGTPNRIKSALDIIIEAPIGAASYNNEFGRPNIFGYFRTCEFNNLIKTKNKSSIGYHKPIMIAGGIGTIRTEDIKKQKLHKNDLIIVLGGPSYLIGIGGGAASSLTSGSSTEDLDFSSVQRDNAEMERRCQEVINFCVYDKSSLIKSIHDIGAGGLCNAVPEIVNESNKGATIHISKVPIGEKNMSPLEVWCNESQERYIIIINQKDSELFDFICKRENCPYSVIGAVTNNKSLVVFDNDDKTKVIDFPMSYLLGKPPVAPIKLLGYKNKHVSNGAYKYRSFNSCVHDVLSLPSVSDKSFLITIGDRSVTGLVSRDQMIGKNQIPVSNIGITMSDIGSKSGQVLTIGEKPLLAITNPVASANMSFGEVITNISCAYIKDLSKIKLSANWMASSKNSNEIDGLYLAVNTLSKLCREFNITIPVGKDSLSMSTRWQDKKIIHEVESPVSLVLSAFSSIDDVKKNITPEIHDNSELFLIKLSDKERLGGSALHQVHNIIDSDVPNLDNNKALERFFRFTQELIKKNIITAYHDISDGGLFATISEMAFTGNCSIIINKNREKYKDDNKIRSFFFNEELGSVIEIPKNKVKLFLNIGSKFKIQKNILQIGSTVVERTPKIIIESKNRIIFSLSSLRKSWSKLSFNIQSMRDNKKTALEEYNGKILTHKSVSSIKLENNLSFNLNSIKIKKIKTSRKPKVAIFREQGVNGQKEMAHAFLQSGFECHDIHVNDIQNKNISLSKYEGIVACGGFSYGDVLGAGKGWASKILYNSVLRDNLEEFFNNTQKFALGVCNGCQMLSQLTSIIPGANHWPTFERNISSQFEARFSRIKINKSKSIFFNEMEGSTLPIIVSHGEGRAVFKNKLHSKNAIINYIDSSNKKTMKYPDNPNGSNEGANGFTNNDGRVTILMPHPERLFSINQYSYIPHEWHTSPWSKFFINARNWLK